MGPARRRFLRRHPCIETGVTNRWEVGGSGAPGTPHPLLKGRAFNQSILFRLLIVRSAGIGAEVASCSR